MRTGSGSTCRQLWILAVVVVSLLASAQPVTAQQWPQIRLVERASGLQRPVTIAFSDDQSGRMFVGEQRGTVQIVRNGQVLSAPFLDIQARVSCCAERGLLGLAFPPGFESKQYFYVYYTDLAGGLVLSRFRVSGGNRDVADPSSERVLLRQAKVNANHNGGQLAFGPDRYLYLAIGDDAVSNNAQNRASLLGKILRIDVEFAAPASLSSATVSVAAPVEDLQTIYLPYLPAATGARQPYRIPPDNPFVGRPGHREEIWVMGLRNPWNFSFDRSTGDLYIGDVGQSEWEEINVKSAGGVGGDNYGWPILEGTHCYASVNCSSAGFVLPVAEYSHQPDGNCAVVAGHTSRSTGQPSLQGIFFYGDYCTGRIWGLRRQAAAWQTGLIQDTALRISTFGVDAQGNLYVADLTTGKIYQIVQA